MALGQQSGARQVSLSGNENHLTLDRVHLLEDQMNELDIAEIASTQLDGKFQWIDVSSMNKIGLGISTSTWWIRLHLRDLDTEMRHYLIVDFSLLEEVEAFIPDNDGRFTVQHSGIAMEAQPLGWKTRVPTFSLDHLSGDSILYLKVKSQSPILIPLLVKSEERYVSSELAKNLFFGVFFGIFFLVICYNLILYVLTKESIYLHYLLYAFFLSILLLNYFGFGYQYLWLGCSDWVDKIMPESIMLVALTMINFIRRFFETKSNFSFIDGFFRVCMMAYLILIPSAFFIPTFILFTLLAPTSSILIVMIVVILVKSCQKNFTPATYVLIGWFFLFVGAISLVGKTFGLLPHTLFTSFAILVGAVVEVIMFTIGIGYRFRWLKNEAKRMTEELKMKHMEIESLRDKIASYLMDNRSTFQLPLTISKADINSYLLNELSERELEVLYRVAEGLTNKEIGEQLFISTNTVRAHMRKIYDKLHVKNRTEAVIKANQLQLIRV